MSYVDLTEERKKRRLRGKHERLWLVFVLSWGEKELSCEVLWVGREALDFGSWTVYVGR